MRNRCGKLLKASALFFDLEEILSREQKKTKDMRSVLSLGQDFHLGGSWYSSAFVK